MSPAKADRVALLALFGLFGLGIAVHAVVATWVPSPVDYDSAYYRSVARHIVDGDGAVIGALWTLLWRPDALPYPADTHWMPLPSRVLVPGVWLWRAHGDQVVTVVLGALWGPLAYLLARRRDATVAVAVAAGLLASTGLAYAVVLATPDCVALFGAIGGLAWLAVFDERPAATAALAVLAALTRNDGFLLAPCLALGFRGLSAWGIAVSGPIAAAAWAVRDLAVVGPAWLDVRRRTVSVLDLDLSSLILGNAPPVTVAERLSFAVTEGIPVVVLVLALIVPFPGLFDLRRDRRSAALAAAWLGIPFVALALAPGVAASGGVYRWSAAVFPAACALTAQALARLGEASRERRGLHPLFLPVMLYGPFAAIALSLGVSATGGPLAGDPCGALADVPRDAVVFSAHPLMIESQCELRSVVLVPGMTAAEVESLAAQYDVRYALIQPEGTIDVFALTPEEAGALLVGWRPTGPTTFAAPVAP